MAREVGAKSWRCKRRTYCEFTLLVQLIAEFTRIFCAHGLLGSHFSLCSMLFSFCHEETTMRIGWAMVG